MIVLRSAFVLWSLHKLESLISNREAVGGGDDVARAVRLVAPRTSRGESTVVF